MELKACLFFCQSVSMGSPFNLIDLGLDFLVAIVTFDAPQTQYPPAAGCWYLVRSVEYGVLRSFLQCSCSTLSLQQNLQLCSIERPVSRLLTTPAEDSYHLLLGTRLIVGGSLSSWFRLSLRQSLCFQGLGHWAFFGAPALVLTMKTKLCLVVVMAVVEGWVAEFLVALSVIEDICFVSAQNPGSEKVSSPLASMLEPFFWFERRISGS